MLPNSDRPLQIGLALMRLTTGAFLLIWAVEKIVAPELARRVFETFYASSPSDLMLLATGLAQAFVVLAFMGGLFKFWTYGAVLVMHSLSLVVTVPRLLDPFTLPNHLFWAAVPVWGLMAALFMLRERDDWLVLARRRSGASGSGAPA